jgi:glucosamine kinase
VSSSFQSGRTTFMPPARRCISLTRASEWPAPKAYTWRPARIVVVIAAATPSMAASFFSSAWSSNPVMCRRQASRTVCCGAMYWTLRAEPGRDNVRSPEWQDGAVPDPSGYPPDPSYVPGRILGIDVGGSGTRVVLLENGTVTPQPGGPPMNALLTDGFAGSLLQIIKAADVAAAGVGMAGLRQEGRARELSETLSRQAGCPVHVTGDADTAQAGAFLGGPGVVVIAGTGSMAFGRSGDRHARAGGHGFVLGDEGSAYWIGRAAASAALWWQDGMGGSEPIHRMVLQARPSGLDDLVNDVTSHPAERSTLTALAPALTALAGEDPEAERITRQAAEHLAALAESVRRRLGPLPVAGAGRVFAAGRIWDRFAELTGAARPLADAAVGAALLAARG